MFIKKHCFFFQIFFMDLIHFQQDEQNLVQTVHSFTKKISIIGLNVFRRPYM